MTPTGIPYANEAWNLTSGCSHAAKGCENCWAERMAKRLVRMGTSYPRDVVNDQGWTGKVIEHPELLSAPLRWQKPRRVFVDAMSDLFHPRVSYPFILSALAVMEACRKHTFMIFTKRTGRMAFFLDIHAFGGWDTNIDRAVGYMNQQKWITGEEQWRIEALLRNQESVWPLPNVWLIASVADQEDADKCIPELLRCPAAVHGVSFEPAVGPIDFSEFPPLDWIIMGCESGARKRRRMDQRWVIDVQRYCEDHNVPFYYKQAVEGRRINRYPAIDNQFYRQLPGGLNE